MFSEYAEGSLQIVFVNGVISLFGSVIVALLMVLYIEEPFNTLKNKRTKQSEIKP